MGEGELGRGADPLAVEQEVDVEGPRTEAGAAAAAGGELEGLGDCQQVAGRQRGPAGDRGVQERGLGGGGDGGRPVEGRGAQRAEDLFETSDRRREGRFGVPPVGAEGQGDGLTVRGPGLERVGTL